MIFYFWLAAHILYWSSPSYFQIKGCQDLDDEHQKSELSISLHVCTLFGWGRGLMMLVAFCLILFTFIFVLYMKKKICFFFDAYFRRVICMAGIYQLTLSSVDHMCSHLNTFVFVSFISYLSEIFRNDVSFLSNFSWRENHFLYYPIFFFLFFTKASSSFSWEIISYYETKLKEIVWLTSLNSFGNKAKIVSLWNIWIFFK